MPTLMCVARLVAAGWWCIGVLFIGGSVTDADEVHVRSLKAGVRIQRGTVEDFRGASLSLRTTGGQLVAIPAAQIHDVQADWLPEHVKADEFVEQRDLVAAMRSYAAAFEEEKRAWVKRRLLAAVVRCQHNLGNELEAGKNFHRLLMDDPETPYFSTIPLVWQTHSPAARAIALAEQWLDGDQPNAMRLVAASWLLSTRLRSTAKDVLQRQMRGADRRLALLARTQLWRTQLVTLDPNVLADWERQVEELPRQLRGGPYFVLGRGHAVLGDSQDALLAWLRLPTQYSDQVSLTQAALVESGRLLELEAARGQAIRLYREAVTFGPSTTRGREATSRLAALSQ